MIRAMSEKNHLDCRSVHLSVQGHADIYISYHTGDYAPTIPLPVLGTSGILPRPKFR